MTPLAPLLLLLGCHATLDLATPPRPAVELRADRVAVIARERACLETADALVRALQPASGMQVDPGAEVKLELFGCGGDQTWTIDERNTQRSLAVAAHAYALVEIGAEGRPVTHLLAAGEHTAGSAASLPPSVRGARREAIEDLARDLVLQLNPVPTLVERRVYPNAPDGSARDLVTRAVHAEAEGDLAAALALVERAMRLDPEPHTASYLRDLRRAASVR